MIAGQRLRPAGRAGEATVQPLLEPRRSGTAVRIAHEGLADGEERAPMRARWEPAPARRAALAALR